MPTRSLSRIASLAACAPPASLSRTVSAAVGAAPSGRAYVTRAGPFSSLTYSRSALPSRSWSTTSSRRVELVSLPAPALAPAPSAVGESFFSVSSRSAAVGEAASVET